MSIFKQKTNQEVVLELLKKAQPWALSLEEILNRSPLPLDIDKPLKKILEALSRLERAKQVARFTYEGVDYFCPYRQRHTCFTIVNVDPPSENTKWWNKALGITMPRWMVRVPTTRVLDDGITKREETGLYRNRYREGYENSSINQHLIRWGLNQKKEHPTPWFIVKEKE